MRSPPRCGGARRGRMPRPHRARRAAQARAARMLDELDAGTLLERFGIPRAPVDRARRGHHARAGAAVPLSGRGQGAVRRDRAQDRRRRRRARRRGRRRAARRDPADPRQRRRRRRPGTRVMRVLVQPMVAGLGEVLIGYRVDPRRRAAGDGRGRRRLDRDLSRPQPAARAGRPRDRARDDRRGARACDALPAIAAGRRAISTRWRDAIVALSQLADDPSIAEAEINPLIVRTRQGVVAVDALVKLA